MPPAEAEILTSYLLRPASLTSVITWERFRALFPRALQDDPAAEPRLRSLWRDLQAQRDAVADEVARAIAAETKRGAALRREVLRARDEAAADGAGADGEVDMERTLFGEASGVKRADHDLKSLVPELDGAAAALEADIAKLQEEEAALTESIRRTVAGLSDLRYGKFANGQLRDEVLDGLMSLESTCEGKARRRTGA